jgi:dTDP-4-dehydrorhamnose reductase
MNKVVILGASGMLGQAVLEQFSEYGAATIATTRVAGQHYLPPETTHIAFDAEIDDLESLSINWSSGDYIINCIGIIKSQIDESNENSVARAYTVNAGFPAKLAKFAEALDLRVIQIATDCVFSGADGRYTEDSEHDPVDVYGITKSLGEVVSPKVLHLRVSIIGRESRGFTSLYEWLVRQPESARVTGYTNHIWNGVPAIHFGRWALAIVEGSKFKSGVQHLIPSDVVSKAELLHLIADHEMRRDLIIENGKAANSIDRSLVTLDPAYNREIWELAGYRQIPSIKQLVAEI